jgi:hypothetical protein
MRLPPGAVSLAATLREEDRRAQGRLRPDQQRHCQSSDFPAVLVRSRVLYGSVDGQKFASAEPTIKSRYSRKYFGKGKGVVAYTLLANHVPLETELIGANEHESHYVFDICYHNTSDIVPTAITGDMHSINKANFAVLHLRVPLILISQRK